MNTDPVETWHVIDDEWADGRIGLGAFGIGRCLICDTREQAELLCAALNSYDAHPVTRDDCYGEFMREDILIQWRYLQSLRDADQHLPDLTPEQVEDVWRDIENIVGESLADGTQALCNELERRYVTK